MVHCHIIDGMGAVVSWEEGKGMMQRIYRPAANQQPKPSMLYLGQVRIVGHGRWQDSNSLHQNGRYDAAGGHCFRTTFVLCLGRS
jgi:hypothetical protein